MHTSMVFCDHCGVELDLKLDEYAIATMKFSEWDKCAQPREYELCENCRIELMNFLECHPPRRFRTPKEYEEETAPKPEPTVVEDKAPIILVSAGDIGTIENRSAAVLDMNIKYDARLIMTFNIGKRPYAMARIYRPRLDDVFALIDLSTNTGTQTYILSYNTSIVHKWSKKNTDNLVRIEYNELLRMTSAITKDEKIPIDDRDYLVNIVRRVLCEQSKSNRVWEITDIKL